MAVLDNNCTILNMNSEKVAFDVEPILLCLFPHRPSTEVVYKPRFKPETIEF